MFSLNAPRQPVKPITKAIEPVTINIKAGSSVKFVICEKLLKVSFSDHAHNPIKHMESPNVQNRTLEPNIKYLRQ